MRPARRSLTTSGVLHSLTLKQINELAALFAYLTPEGWVIPAWIREL